MLPPREIDAESKSSVVVNSVSHKGVPKPKAKDATAEVRNLMECITQSIHLVSSLGEGRDVGVLVQV